MDLSCTTKLQTQVNNDIWNWSKIWHLFCFYNQASVDKMLVCKPKLKSRMSVKGGVKSTLYAAYPGKLSMALLLLTYQVQDKDKVHCIIRVFTSQRLTWRALFSGIGQYTVCLSYSWFFCGRSPSSWPKCDVSWGEMEAHLLHGLDYINSTTRRRRWVNLSQWQTYSAQKSHNLS